MSKKKKKHNSNQKQLSPVNYIKTRARTLPIAFCRINSNWKESGMASIMVARRHVNDNITVGIYLVDMLALGVKDTFFAFNEPEFSLSEKLQTFYGSDQIEDCDYVLAHNIIYGAEAFADEYGFKAHKDFGFTQFILEEDTEDVELIEIEFGKDGKPLLIDTGADWDEDDSGDEYDDENEFGETINHRYDKYPEEMEGNSVANSENLIKVDYIITGEPISPFEYFKDEEERKKSEEIYYKLTEETSKSELKKIVSEIERAIEISPDNPIYYNHLSTAYGLLDKYEKQEEVVEACCEKFPNYLFGKIQYALKLLDKKRYDEVPAIFNHKYDLKSLYPERDVFHVSEVINFHSVLCFYFLQIDNLKNAKFHLGLMKKLENKFDYYVDVTRQVESEILRYKAIRPLLR